MFSLDKIRYKIPSVEAYWLKHRYHGINDKTHFAVDQPSLLLEQPSLSMADRVSIPQVIRGPPFIRTKYSHAKPAEPDAGPSGVLCRGQDTIARMQP